MAGVEVSTDDGATLAPGHRHDVVVVLAGSRTARRARRSGRARSMTPATSSRRRRASPSASAARARCSARTRRRRSSTRRIPRRSSWACASRPTSTAPSPASASTSRRRTPARHIGNLWSANGTLLATGTFSGESATGWQQLTFTTPVDITAGTTYVASYFAPRGHYSTSSAYFFMPSPTGGNTARHARRCTRSAPTAAAPTASTPTRATRRSRTRRTTARTTPSTSSSRRSSRRARSATSRATAGTGSATVNFTAPATGGPPTRYVVTPFIGSTAQPTTTVDGLAAGDVGEGQRPRRRDGVHVQGPGGQRQRDQSALGAVERGHADRRRRPRARRRRSSPSAGNQQATLRWTAPNDGGATITRYTITPYLNGVAQATTAVTGSPAPDDRGRDRA